MDFSKLSQAEKLGAIGAAAAIVGGLAGGITALMWLAVLAALGMLAVIFIPQFSPNTSLPGSKGSLMVICGGIGAAAGVLALLSIIGLLGFWFEFSPIQALLFLVGVAGAVVMGWAGWQAFQAEGGNFQVGTASSTTREGTATTRAEGTPPDERSASSAAEPAPAERSAPLAAGDRTTTDERAAEPAPPPAETRTAETTPPPPADERREPPTS